MNLSDYVANAGESPWWDPVTARLLWVDIRADRVLRCDLQNGDMQIFDVPGMPSFVAPLHSGELLCATREGLCGLDPGTGSRRVLLWPAWLGQGMRFNDGTVDPDGRLIIGTMSMQKGDIPFTGALYAVGADMRPYRLLDELGIVNGLAFSLDGSSLYVADSHPNRRIIWQFDYDRQAPKLSHRRVVADFRAMDLAGTPDGAAMDDADGYWVAAHGAGKILRFGAEMQSWDVSCLQVSKPAFVGQRRDSVALTGFGSALVIQDFGYRGPPLAQLSW
jgi:sugar lactone lactonase YvrE